MLSETSQLQKENDMIQLIQGIHRSQVRKENGGCLGAGEGKGVSSGFSRVSVGMTRSSGGDGAKAAHLGELHLIPLHFVLQNGLNGNFYGFFHYTGF